MRPIAAILLTIAVATTSPSVAADWSPQPWLDDLAQTRQAFATKYANLDWLEHDRGLPLAILFAKASDRLRAARSDEDAKAVFARLIERVGDGHVAIEWPRASPIPPVSATKPNDVCDDLGFDEHRALPGAAAALPGYRPLDAAGPFPAGIVHVGARSLGVLRIAGFEPQGSPPICRAALRALHVSAERPCDDACQDAILTWSFDRLTEALEAQVRAVRAAGARILLVDVTGNGGGTEWVEAAARIVSPKILASERRGFVRGPHWAERWKTLAARLRSAAVSADMPDRAHLTNWAAEAEQARGDAGRSCSSGCALVGQADYATGLVGTARAGAFAGKPWADMVFSPAQFPYHDGVWTGPLVVLVDDETWSSAEQFAAILQDNAAAAIIGTRTGGAGCGHTDGGTPTILANSEATLELPDCVRYRADGSNEVAGIIPDVLTGIKASDGATFKARLIAAHLAQAIELANARRRKSPTHPSR